jgi:hypothetical protein
MKIFTYDPAKGKEVLCREIQGDTFFRWVKPEHFMIVNQSYGIQETAFQQLIENGVEKIVLKEENTGKRWEASVEMWLIHGSVQEYSGHSKQRFLSMKYQDVHKIPEPIL